MEALSDEDKRLLIEQMDEFAKNTRSTPILCRFARAYTN